MIPAIVLQALVDRRLDTSHRLVYRAALQSLSWHQPRPFKVMAIANQVHNRNGRPMHRATVTRARARLVEFGYLERGPNDGRLSTYLLRNELPEAIP